MRVAVLGGGLQGATVAMELVDRGAEVDLYDREPQCMTQASLNNEGKIHLGYVYANDRSRRTAAAMVEGAATFAPYLQRWLGASRVGLVTSASFNYAVHRDSLLDPEEVASHMRETHRLGVERITGGEYFGIDVSKPPRLLTHGELESDYDPATIAAVFRTSEVAIDPAALAKAVRSRVSVDDSIKTVFETQVRGVAIGEQRVTVLYTDSSGEGAVDYDHVVNALWEGRLAVDASAGIPPPRPWLHRVKHFLLVRSDVSLPTTTIVLGPFGDVVDYADGSCYLSWYPSGLQGTSSDLELPARLRNPPDASTAKIRSGIAAGLASVIPGVSRIPEDDLASAQLLGGAIFAWGSSDIDDRLSELHNRFEIGVASYGRYHTVDTGKLTVAPLFARVVGKRVLP